MYLNEKQKILLKTIASRYQIARVSAWLFDDSRSSITSEAIYNLRKNDFSQGITLKKTDFPVYFKALEDNSVIAANDAVYDERTAEFGEVYLKPLGITSMLDIPLKDGEKVIGVLCLEHIGEKRVWTNEEMLDALSVAHQISITIETEEKNLIEKALKESEQRFALALNALPVIFWTVNQNLLVTGCKGHGMDKTNVDENDIIGIPLEKVLGIKSDDPAILNHRKALKGESVSFEYKYTGFYFQVFIEPLKDYEKNINSCIGIAINIDEQKKAERELKERENQLVSLFDTVADSIFVIEVESENSFRFISVNDAFKKITGVAEEQLIGKLISDIVPQPSLNLVLSKYKQAIKTKQSVVWEETTDYPTGRLTGIVTIAPLFDETGVCKKLIGSVKDITERKKIELSLKESEERFRVLAESSNIIPWEIDAATFKCTYVGPQAESVLGYPTQAWYDTDFWFNHIHPDDRDIANHRFLQGLKKNQNYDFEYRMVKADGKIVWFHDFVTIVNDESGKPLKLRGHLIDVTIRKLAEEKIQKLNAELEERVEERTAQLQANITELNKAKIQAEESKAAKELFLASMSHEIRTPLNAIIGFQQLLKSTSLTAEQKEYVESIDFAGKNLLVIINDILDLSKIEAGKFQFDETDFNVSDVVKSVIELVNHRAKEKKLKLYIYVDSSIPDKLFGDAARLSQVLLNLVGNAIKFTEAGDVKVSVNALEETSEQVLCEFIVEDSGIGISPERMASIFERFTQESNETNRIYGGTGLGLTISKYLVEMQGGKIEVKSEKGKGSAFSFQLRYKKKSSDQAHIADGDDIDHDHILKNLKILLVEDVLLNQKLVMKIMEKWGYELDIANNGIEGVEKVKQKNYDLILMDIQMPVMDGYAATELIRSLPDLEKQRIPIIALTAHASHAEAEKCINLGMNAYMAKPFNQLELQKIISRLVMKK